MPDLLEENNLRQKTPIDPISQLTSAIYGDQVKVVANLLKRDQFQNLEVLSKIYKELGLEPDSDLRTFKLFNDKMAELKLDKPRKKVVEKTIKPAVALAFAQPKTSREQLLDAIRDEKPLFAKNLLKHFVSELSTADVSEAKKMAQELGFRDFVKAAADVLLDLEGAVAL